MENKDIQKIQDELFCLQFEMKALAGITVRGEAERWVSGFLWPNYEAEHVLRYELALQYAAGKKVIDIACGSGYGSYLLAQKGHATEVLGGDLDAEAIRYGNLKYPHARVNRTLIDAEQFKKEGYFDVAVSFETIEHLNNYEQFLKNIYDSLVPGGLLLISTPIVGETRTNCDNPYHKIEWSFLDFQSLLKKQFIIEKIFIQNAGLLKKKKGVVSKVFKKIQLFISDRLPNAELMDFTPREFTGQYPASKLVSGYQILACRKQ